MQSSSKTSGYIRENYLDQIKQYLNPDLIKVIVGLRRSGKSVLMRQLVDFLVRGLKVDENDILYIDKENLTFDFIAHYKDLYTYVKKANPRYVLIDEVQEIEAWEKAVASFHKEGIEVFITGSNANMLSSDLATYLSGRYVLIPIYTLSFKEFTTFNDRGHQDLSKDFADYMRIGGFPLLSQFTGNQQACQTIIRDIFETIILKDIVARHNIRRVKLLNNIIHYAIDNIGNTFSANKIAEYLKSQRIKIDVETVYSYLGYLTSAFALHQVRRYDIRGKRYLEISEKYYLGDLGLRHALVGYRSEHINQFLENIVFLELLRRGFRVSIGKVGDKEIDFIAEKPGETLYFQVCYLLATPQVFEREFGVLQEIKDNHPKMVLSLDTPDFGSAFSGIKRKNLIVWLLEDPSRTL